MVILTKAILRHCLGVQWWNCPHKNLCPRIPSRLNYLLWLNLQLKDVKLEKILDVGTGATLIYPLLGWHVFGWKFIATEIDEESYHHSKTIIEKNALT